MNPLRRLAPTMIILCAIAVVGTAGYILLEGWSILDSVYMVITTLFTVGFMEVHQLTAPGRIFTMVIIVSGVGTALYAAGQVVDMMVEGEIIGYRRKKKMEHKIRTMKDHYIICGFGRMGHQVAAEFDAAGIPYVVLDRKHEIEEELGPRGIPYIVGDVIADENLEEAGIRKAKVLIACADSDVANVYITLTARSMNPALYIIVRAGEQESEGKLKMAGADRVISPYFISGKRMAAWATRPVASDFLDMVMHGEGLEFSLHEVPILAGSPLIGKTLAEAEIRTRAGALVLAIHKKNGTFNLQPQAADLIEEGSTLIVVGTREQIELLVKIAA